MKKTIRYAIALLFVTLNVNAFAQIRITEVGYNGVTFDGANKWVELYNAGEAEVDVSTLILCNIPQYPVINTLTALDGSSTTIPAGGYLVVAWPDLGDDDAEVGLYKENSFGAFGNADNILDYMQYGEAGHGREGVANDAGVWVTGQFVPAAESGLSLQLVNLDEVGAESWVAAEPTPNAPNGGGAAFETIRITEVGINVDYEGASKWVELYNSGDSEVDVTDLILCNIPMYPLVSSLTILGGGNLVMPAGGYLVLSWADLGDDDAEVGLYLPDSFGGFGEASNILDYMQYGEAGHGREGVANDAGVWVTGEFVELGDAGTSLQLVDAENVGSASWVAAEPTPNAPNGGSSAFETIRVSEVGINVDYEGASKWVELHNMGDSEVDVTDLILCNIPMYPLVSSLTILGGGSLVMPADGYLVLAWADLGDDDAEVGLYLPDSFGGFGEASNILDYMQYGEAGHGREGVANDAGVWVTGEFVALGDAGTSLQLVDAENAGSASWAAAAPTPNEENNTATSNEEIDEVPGAFTLNANFPNPFNPETSITYDLNRNGEVALSVFDMLGQKVVDLYQGLQGAGSYSVSWDGRDARGNTVASGLYLYRLTFDGIQAQSRVMTLLK